MAGCVPKTLDLLGLSLQHGDCVEDQIDELEGPRTEGGCVGHVSQDDGDRFLIGLHTQLLDHGAAQLDPGDRNALGCQRDGHSACTDGELQRLSTTGDFAEGVHRRPENVRCEHSSAWRVVALRRIGIPDLFLSHARTCSRRSGRVSTAFPALRSHAHASHDSDRGPRCERPDGSSLITSCQNRGGRT